MNSRRVGTFELQLINSNRNLLATLKSMAMAKISTWPRYPKWMNSDGHRQALQPAVDDSILNYN